MSIYFKMENDLDWARRPTLIEKEEDTPWWTYKYTLINEDSGKSIPFNPCAQDEMMKIKKGGFVAKAIFNADSFVDTFINDMKLRYGPLAYKKIIFNEPATIVLWNDGTKTVVKCGERDVYDPEKGIALCFMKKALGNTSRNLNKILNKEVPLYYEKHGDKE